MKYCLYFPHKRKKLFTANEKIFSGLQSFAFLDAYNTVTTADFGKYARNELKYANKLDFSCIVW